MKIGKEIAIQAKKKGICKEWFSEMLKQEDIRPLCKMFFDGSDWAMENNFPDIQTLRRFKGISDKFGLHTDFKGVVGLDSMLNRVAFFGDSESEINAGGFVVGEIYLRHNSKAKITASGNSFLVVNLLDNSFVEIEATENSQVSVFQYGNNSNFRITGNVEIIEKQWAK